MISQQAHILPHHLALLALIYIRQSTAQQVDHHLESQDLQYRLHQRALDLGWPAARIRIIDDDLGKSAIAADQRFGFQEVMALVGLNQVGIILVTDVSRLARNCSDWYHLLDLASLSGALLCDMSGLYDPRIYNDRLLLGLKGVFSEAQWHAMRQHLYAALLNKARRGELNLRLPLGYERLDNGEVVKTPDLEVQAAIELLFAQFQRLGSVAAVLRYFRDHKLQLPRKWQLGPAAGRVQWVDPGFSLIYHVLKQPAYAGAYAYGKSHRQRLPGAEGKVVVRQQAVENWPVLIHDHYPAYISWQQFLDNQARLAANAQGLHFGRAAVGHGEALLSGIVHCARSGRKMRVLYKRRPAYVCQHERHTQAGPTCQYFSLSHIDAPVVTRFLQALQPAELEIALAAAQEVDAQRQQVAEQWRKRLQRAQYEVDLARRRYEQVKPERRLVAAELERLWDEKLQEPQGLQQQWLQVQGRELRPLSEAETAHIRQLAHDLPALWQAETTTPAERKRLLRCLIESVTLDRFSQPHHSLIHLRWRTGAEETISVERPGCGRQPAHSLHERIRDLAQRHPDDEIVRILNQEGVTTAAGLNWNLQRLRGVRAKRHIASACPAQFAPPGPRGDGLVSSKEAAQLLGVTASMINDWYRRGWLVGHQRRPGAPLWVRMNAADIARYDGSAAPAADLIPLAEAPARFGLDPDQLAAAQQF